MAQRERMSSVDTAWLRMDRPHNLMMIAGVLVFTDRLDFKRLAQVVTTRMLTYRRFRQRPVTDATGTYWLDDPNFVIGRHLRRVRLAGERGESELQALVAELIATPLTDDRPRWDFAVVENYRGGSALISRVHHCYADGIALIGVMLSLTDSSATPARPEARPADIAKHPSQASDTIGSPLAQLFEPVSDAVRAAMRISANAVERSLKLARDPGEMVDYAVIGAKVGRELAQLAMMADDTPTRFKGRPAATKRVAWTDRLPLDEVKAVGRALGCSVNDVLLACVAGALRTYIEAKGDPSDAVELRALVPVNLRPPGREHKLGNRFGLVALELPVGMGNPIARLHEVHQRMEALKSSYQAPLTLGLLGLVGLCPKAVQEQVLDLLASKATAVMTNVPGPQQPLYLAGSALDHLMFWVPQSGDVGMGVSILSYNGGVRFGLVTDAGLTPDPENIAARFAPEFEKLVFAVLMEPWDEPRDPALIDREIASAEKDLR